MKRERYTLPGKRDMLLYALAGAAQDEALGFQRSGVDRNMYQVSQDVIGIEKAIHRMDRKEQEALTRRRTDAAEIESIRRAVRNGTL